MSFYGSYCPEAKNDNKGKALHTQQPLLFSKYAVIKSAFSESEKRVGLLASLPEGKASASPGPHPGAPPGTRRAAAALGSEEESKDPAIQFGVRPEEWK